MSAMLSAVVTACALGFIGGTAKHAAPSRARTMPQLATRVYPDVPKPLTWRPTGHSYWTWKGLDPAKGKSARVHYVASGPEDGEPLVLVHGFGASHFHWRYNIPELSKTCRVYAVDLLGFGLSDKPLIEYTGEMWGRQLNDFMREIVMPGAPTKAALAGNSLGGFAALAAAAADPSLSRGVALLNAAGKFRAPEDESPEGFVDKVEEPIERWASAIRENVVALAQRAVLYGSFQLTRQPQRIKQVLEQVYPVDKSFVDDALVESIRAPADDPNAAEVFYRIVSRNAVNPAKTLDDLLEELCADTDVLLLWGEQDPWIRPAAADRIQALRPSASRVSLEAGHCPHDETPGPVNAALADWMLSLKK